MPEPPAPTTIRRKTFFCSALFVWGAASALVVFVLVAPSIMEHHRGTGVAIGFLLAAAVVLSFAVLLDRYITPIQRVMEYLTRHMELQNKLLAEGVVPLARKDVPASTGSIQIRQRRAN